MILGKPNVGKSSLLNALLKEERAIVTDIPGTTRDILEEQLDIRGIFFRIIDTAGMRRTTNVVEQAGVERSEQQMRNADIILAMFDGSRPLEKEDRILAEHIRSGRSSGATKPVVAILNKRDLTPQLTLDHIRTLVGVDAIVEISAKEHSGLEILEEVLVRTVMGADDGFSREPLVANLRQQQALERSAAALNRAQVSLLDGLSGEFVAVDLREGIDMLGEMIGEVTSEDILGTIFARFCIGK